MMDERSVKYYRDFDAWIDEVERILDIPSPDYIIDEYEVFFDAGKTPQEYVDYLFKKDENV